LIGNLEEREGGETERKVEEVGGVLAGGESGEGGRGYWGGGAGVSKKGKKKSFFVCWGV